jgi:RNA polymerase sigma-70 factor (ECF subfamily)
VEAFGRLVELHGSAVFRTALAALRSRPEAEDAAQEAFLSAFERLATFRREASFRTWLLSIAWRKALDRRRSLRSRLRRFLPQADGDAVAAPNLGACEVLADAQTAARVGGLVRRLPARLRDPLLLAASEEHSYGEVAALLGRPVGTIKSQVHEAREMLRRWLVQMEQARE